MFEHGIAEHRIKRLRRKTAHVIGIDGTNDKFFEPGFAGLVDPDLFRGPLKRGKGQQGRIITRGTDFEHGAANIMRTADIVEQIIYRGVHVNSAAQLFDRAPIQAVSQVPELASRAEVIAIEVGDAPDFRGARNGWNGAVRRMSLPGGSLKHLRIRCDRQKSKYRRQGFPGLAAEILVAQAVTTAGQIAMKLQHLLLVIGPAFHFFRGGKPEPEISVSGLIEPIRTGRHIEGMANDVQKMGFGKMLPEKFEDFGVRVLHRFFITDPLHALVFAGRQPGSPLLHQGGLSGQEVFRGSGLTVEQMAGELEGHLHSLVRVPGVGTKRLVLMKLIENPGDVRFVGDEYLGMQVQDPDKLGSAGALVANDKQGAYHLCR